RWSMDTDFELPLDLEPDEVTPVAAPPARRELPPVGPRPSPGEPPPHDSWYYRFLEHYGLPAAALGLLLVWAALAGGENLAAFLGFGADETGRSALVVATSRVLLFAGLLLGVLFLAAATCLVVDAGRNLRAIRQRLEQEVPEPPATARD